MGRKDDKGANDEEVQGVRRKKWRKGWQIVLNVGGRGGNDAGDRIIIVVRSTRKDLGQWKSRFPLLRRWRYSGEV